MDGQLGSRPCGRRHGLGMRVVHMYVASYPGLGARLMCMAWVQG